MGTTESVEREPAAPWWRFPLVWMVIAGPACVVVAGFVTLAVAVRVPDPVVAQDDDRRGAGIGTLPDKRLMPAMAGRNHAATPREDVPPPRRESP